MARRRRKAAAGAWASLAGDAAFVFDCQAVVALRMVRLCAGGDAAAREANLMVAEKMAAFAGAQLDAAAAFTEAGLPGATAAVMRRYRRAVAGNRRRLSRGA
jgi:hypothetical protein